MNSTFNTSILMLMIPYVSKVQIGKLTIDLGIH